MKQLLFIIITFMFVSNVYGQDKEGWAWLLITVGLNLDGALMDKPYLNLLYDSKDECEGMLKNVHDKNIEEGKVSTVHLTDEHRIYYQHYEGEVLYTEYCIKALNLKESIEEGFKQL